MSKGHFGRCVEMPAPMVDGALGIRVRRVRLELLDRGRIDRRHPRPHAGPDGLPALVLTGPLSGVKDQVVGTYAELLAAEGFATLAFDHRNFGESEGEPRQHEDSAGKLADLRDAVTFLAGRAEIDENRIGAVGITTSFEGQYADFEKVLAKLRPSVSTDDLERFEEFRVEGA